MPLLSRKATGRVDPVKSLRPAVAVQKGYWQSSAEAVSAYANFHTSMQSETVSTAAASRAQCRLEVLVHQHTALACPQGDHSMGRVCCPDKRFDTVTDTMTMRLQHLHMISSSSATSHISLRG